MEIKTGLKSFASVALGATCLCSLSFGGDPDGSLTTAPGEAAIAGYFQSAHQTKLSAQSAPTPKSPGDKYTLTVDVAPGAGSTAFREQSPAYSSVVTTTVEKNGAAVSSTSAAVYFRLRPFGFLGKAVGKGSPYGVIKGFHQLPFTATVGDGGSFNDMGLYHDSDMATVDAEQTGSFTVAPNDSSSLLLCLSTTLRNVTPKGTEDGLSATTQSDCYRVGTAGKAELVSVEMAVGGETLTFR